MNHQHPDTALMVFAKAPVPGQVKTRLIPALGERGASEWYQNMAQQIISTIHQAGICPMTLCCYPDTMHPFFTHLRQQFDIDLIEQKGNDLGERMLNAIKHGLSKHRQAIVIGTDCPTLTPRYILDAIKAIKKYDVVIGPAKDGGYVLIGMSKAHRRLFVDIPWGSERVLSATLAKIKESELTVKQLEPLQDIDRPSDLYGGQADKTHNYLF